MAARGYPESIRIETLRARRLGAPALGRSGHPFGFSGKRPSRSSPRLYASASVD